MFISIVPHLPSENNLYGIVSGLDNQPACVSDLYVTPLKNVLSQCSFSFVIASSMQRSLDTIVECVDDKVETIVDDRLLPVNYGDYHGTSKLNVSDISHKYVAVPFPNGESFNDMATRHSEFFNEYREILKDKNVLLIGHEGSDSVLRYLGSNESMEVDLQKTAEKRRERMAKGIKREQAFMNSPQGPFIFHKSFYD